MVASKRNKPWMVDVILAQGLGRCGFGLRLGWSAKEVPICLCHLLERNCIVARPNRQLAIPFFLNRTIFCRLRVHESSVDHLRNLQRRHGDVSAVEDGGPILIRVQALGVIEASSWYLPLTGTSDRSRPKPGAYATQLRLFSH
jgi:hypothetical protein